MKYWPDLKAAWSTAGLSCAQVSQVLTRMLGEHTSPHGRKFFGDKYAVLVEVGVERELITDLMMRVSLLPGFPPVSKDVANHMSTTIVKAFEVAQALKYVCQLSLLWPDDHQMCDLDNAYLFEERAKQTGAWKFAEEYVGR